MKRIVFLLKNMPSQEAMDEYMEYARDYDVEVLYLQAQNCDSAFAVRAKEAGTTGEKEDGGIGCMAFKTSPPGFVPEYEDIVCTDSEEEYMRLNRMGEKAVVAVEDIADAGKFEGARYLLLDSQDTEIEYYRKVWMRFRNIPWQIKETKRLIIRETTVADVDRFVELYKDPSMYKYTEALYENIEEERKYAREYIEKVYEVQGFGIWTVILKESNEIIGRVGLVTREGFEGVEIGYSIGVDYQRKGFAQEAVEACLSFAKENELSPVRVLTMAENTASVGLLKKLGFERVGQVSLNYVSYDEYLWPQ